MTLKTVIFCNSYRGRKMLSPFPVVLAGRRIVAVGRAFGDRTLALREGRQLLKAVQMGELR